jgi:hypothetical protein
VLQELTTKTSKPTDMIAEPREENLTVAAIAAESEIRRLSASSFEAIVVSMRVRLGNALAQKEGLAALLDVCANGQDLAHQTVAMDTVSAAVVAMKAHPRDADVQEWACLALDRLISYDSSCQTAAGQIGGFETIVTAMKTYRNNVGVQARACAALASLSANNVGNQARAVAASVPESILVALQAHPCNKMIRHWGEKTLKQLHPCDEPVVVVRGGG